MKVLATLWLIAGLIIIPMNAMFMLKLAAFIAVALLMGLLATCGLGYVLDERLSRGLAQEALRAGVPERPVALGVTSRMLIVWALSTGVPLLGLVLIGLGSWIGLLPATGGDLERAAIFMSVIALSVGLLATALLARALADPLRSLRHALERVRLGDLQTEVSVYDGSEIGLLQAGFNEMLGGLREREHMRDIFSRHVGEDVAAQALEQGVVLGGETREVAVLFIDLVGSTELASELPPQDVVRLLNEFFGVVVAVVSRHGGSVNKFEGDAAMCVFGAPADRDDAAGDALAAARELNELLGEAIPELGVGIGVSAGVAVAGNIGASERFEYTVIGDPVNEAARLTELAKNLPGRVLASDSAVTRANPREAAHWLLGESVQLRGRPVATVTATPVQAAG